MPLTRDTVFERVYVDYLLEGASRVTWELRPTFSDTTPYSFQLQVNRNEGETGDWTDVGAALPNTYTTTDSLKRQFGKSLTVAYRVVLTTPVDTYTSPAAQTLGNLSERQWLAARAIIRRAKLFQRRLQPFQGFLLKRKRHGAICTHCVDPVTGGCLDSDCTYCKGTTRVDGYWQATANTMFDMSPENDDTKLSELGTVDDVMVQGTCIGLPQITRNDVWVDANSDRRYYVEKVSAVAEMNRVPLIVKPVLRLAEFSDVVYTVPLEGV